MPRQRTGRAAPATRQRAQDSSNGNDINDGLITPVTHEYSINAPHTVRHTSTWDVLDELEDAPLIPLTVLLCSDATPREIVRRLRLNVAIRMLLDAIREQGVA